MALREDKRRQILDAAIGEFLKNGFDGASMDRIAAGANVSKRTVYNHFEGKEVLFQTISDMAVEQVNAAISITYDPALPLRDQLIALGEEEGRLISSVAFMRMMRLAASEVLRDSTMAMELDRRTCIVDIVNAFFTGAANSGALKTDDPPLVAEQFIGLIKARTFWPSIFFRKTVTPDEMSRVIEESADTIIAAFGRDKD